MTSKTSLGTAHPAWGGGILYSTFPAPPLGAEPTGPTPSGSVGPPGLLPPDWPAKRSQPLRRWHGCNPQHQPHAHPQEHVPQAQRLSRNLRPRPSRKARSHAQRAPAILGAGDIDVGKQSSSPRGISIPAGETYHKLSHKYII